MSSQSTRFRARVERLDDRCLPSVSQLLALGADVGGGPHVRVIDPKTGQDKLSFMAYDPSFRGGVSVALADLTGDGIPEIVTGPGAGGGPHVKIFEGRTGVNYASFFAYDPAFRGGISVAVGDIDGDGVAEIITAPGKGGGPHVKVFDLGGGLKSQFMAYDPAFRGGVSVAVDDVNGDFRADIVTGAGVGGGPHVRVFDGTGAPFGSFFAYDASFRGGVNVAAGDLDADGEAEIITGAGAGGGPHVKVFDSAAGTTRASFLAFGTLFIDGTRVGVSDGDGDGRPDVVAGSGGQWRYYDTTLYRQLGGGNAYGPAYGGGVWVAGPRMQAIDPASADAVLDWNQITLDAIRSTNMPPPKASRALAMVSVAVYDAVNAIVPLHATYHVSTSPHPSASISATVASASHKVLVALFPTLSATFDTALAASLAEVSDGAPKTEGIALGEEVATAVLAWRANDGSSATVPYTPGMAPGQWQPTPPANAAALLPNWPLVTPFAMTSGNQFRPAAPPALDSAAYGAALNEVKDLGRVDVTTRTTEQTQVALYWADGGGTVTPPGHWNLITRDLALRLGLSAVENARLFAQLNVALADAAISCWDTKYAYNLWRPITAIRNADTDGNAATTVDATWTPLLVTPPFPSYSSGHSTFSGAADVVLSNYFGANTAFSSRGDVAQSFTRSFTSFTDAANEAGRSRVYGGIHFEFDNQAGLAAGRALGQFVSTTLMQ